MSKRIKAFSFLFSALFLASAFLLSACNDKPSAPVVADGPYTTDMHQKKDSSGSNPDGKRPPDDKGDGGLSKNDPDDGPYNPEAKVPPVYDTSRYAPAVYDPNAQKP